MFHTIKCKCGKVLAEALSGSTVRGFCKRCKEYTTKTIK